MFYYIYPGMLDMGEQYYIYNENRQPAFQVMRVMTPQGPQTCLLNIFRQELFAIRRERNYPEIRIFQNGIHIGSVSNDPAYGYVRTVFSFTNLVLSGPVGQHNYTIYQNSNIVGKVNSFQPYANQYAMYVADSYPDHALLCALSIAVDTCIYNYN